MRVISGKARGTVLKTPDGMHTRPTADRVKEAMFSILQFDLPGNRVLDLFGGTGQLGIEALSRGASFAVFVDEREDACRLIRENLSRTKFSGQGRVVRGDYLSYLRTEKESFGIILLDPPYGKEFLENALKVITEIDILQSGGIILLERPVEQALSLVYPGFVHTRDYKYGKTMLSVLRKEQANESL